MSIYCFLKDKVIGKNGFAFRKNTFVSNKSNIHLFSAEKISSLNVEYKDCLIKEELIDLIYSFYKYKGTAKKYKNLLEEVLFKLNSISL
jgi:hypothetical protein